MSDSPDIGTPLEAAAWIGPIHDARVLSDDPAEPAVQRESVRLAFVAALANLPPQQRAILVLREVLDWSAAEVAELLGTSVDAVTSALARARATMRKPAGTERPLGDGDRSLLERYVAAFEAYDVAALVGLLRADATFVMPPYAFWLRGREDIRRWWDGPGAVCRVHGSFVLGPTAGRRSRCITRSAVDASSRSRFTSSTCRTA